MTPPLVSLELGKKNPNIMHIYMGSVTFIFSRTFHATYEIFSQFPQKISVDLWLQLKSFYKYIALFQTEFLVTEKLNLSDKIFLSSMKFRKIT